MWTLNFRFEICSLQKLEGFLEVHVVGVIDVNVIELNFMLLKSSHFGLKQ